MKRFLALVLAAMSLAVVAPAAQAHWPYTAAEALNNLKDTNFDRACGHGTGHFCTNSSISLSNAGKEGAHSYRISFGFTEWGPSFSDGQWRCTGSVRVFSHNEGGRVNIAEVYSGGAGRCTIPYWIVP